MLKKLFWQSLSTISLILFLGCGYLFIPQHFSALDSRLRDFLFILRGPIPTTQSVVIINVDEESLKAHGQWPWSRDLLADLLIRLSDAGAGIIGLDMVFAEPDKTSPVRIAEKLALPKEKLDDYDLQLAKVFKIAPVVGGYFFSFEENSSLEGPLIPAVLIEKGSGSGHFIPEPTSVVLNIPLLQNAFYSSGFFNNLPDSGGMIRHVPLIMRYDMTLFPSLALEMIRIYRQTGQVQINNSMTGVGSIDLGELHIPTDRFGRLSVNFRGPGYHFSYISAADVLNGRFDTALVEGKFVLVGTSAIGLSDLRATPYDGAMPGVEVYANVIDNILQKDFLFKSENAELFDLAMITMTVLVGVLLFTLLNEWLILPTFFALLYSMYLFFSIMLFEQGMVLSILFPVMGLIFSMILSVAIDYILTSEQKRAVMQSFARKVSPAVMHDLINREAGGLLKPTEKEVTIFFSDIRSFTTISEAIGSPKRLIALLNAYMTPMVNIIVKQLGTVDKFIGDSIMAYWNAPNIVSSHADRAVESALEQIHILQKLNKSLKKKFDVELEISIGINTGTVTVGEMGSAGRSDYTIIGDHVNLASRLEGLNKLYGTNIIISSFTKAKLTKAYALRPLDLVRVKGKKEAVEIFEVLPKHKQDEISGPETELYTEALDLFRCGKVKEAHALFSELVAEHDLKLYERYLSRCQECLDHPEKAFEKTVTMQNK